jgi:hypothetical protein
MKFLQNWKVLFITAAMTFCLVLTENILLADDYLCTGSVGPISVDNLRVPQHANCILNGTRIEGNIELFANATLEAANIYVDGNIQSIENMVTRVYVYNSSYVDGNIQIKKSGAVDIKDVWVDGDIQVDNNYNFLNFERNVIGGNLQAFQNTGGISIISNTIGGNLQCKENAPPPSGGENIVSGNMEDQCKNLFDPAPIPPVDDSETIPIWDWHDLDAVRRDLNGRYLLMRTLDPTIAGYGELAGETADHGMGWQPIGDYPDRFTGSFDGQGFELQSLFINRPGTDRIGLFARSGGTIRNVALVNANVTGDRWVGALVGVNVGAIIDSRVTGNVRGSMSVGGLSGTNESNGRVSNSHSSGNVDGLHHVGGLVGWNGNQGIVVNSCSSSNVTGGDWQTGGLVGTTFRSTISNACAAGSVAGGSDVGALAGLSSYSIVHSSYATGSVTGDTHIGGLVGRNYWSTLSNSYSTGSVTGNHLVGGLVGLNSSGTVRNSFWDLMTSGIHISSGGTGKTSSELRTLATFTDPATNGLDSPWDIIRVDSGRTNKEYTWNMSESYPFLGGKDLYRLTISTTDDGSVTAPGEGIFIRDIGTVVDLAAMPDKGYRFTNWTGDIDFIANAASATTTITMVDNISITANFTESSVDESSDTELSGGRNERSAGGGGCSLNPQCTPGAEWILMTLVLSMIYLRRRSR